MAISEAEQHLEMHIRVKRKNTVLFLYVDPSETIRDVKNKIEAILGQPTTNQRLLKDKVVLSGDGKTLAELKVEFDDELALVYKVEGTEDSWEEVETSTPKPEDAKPSQLSS